LAQSKKRLNILYVFGFNYSLNLWKESGALEREFYYFENLARSEEVHITLITYGDSVDYNLFNYQHISIIPIYSVLKKTNFKTLSFLKSLVFPFKIYKNLFHIDIIKQNQLTGSWVSIILKFLLKKPLYVRTGYDAYLFSIMDKKNVFKKIIFKTLTKLCLKYSDLYSVTSKSDYEFILLNYNFEESKLVLRPNWVLKSGKSVDIKAKNNKSILSVGRLEKQKNYNFLISVLKNSNFELTIVGDGSEKENLIESAKANQVKLIVENGLSYFELLELFRSYKYFILPSIYEGNPKVLLEAMSEGLVVFASKIPNHEEIIDDHEDGILFSLQNNELIDKLNRVSNDITLQNKLSTSAALKMQNNYSVEVCIEKELSDYQNLLNKI
jgi:glycosyltransferase involved in cell wall biosynthesis